MGRTVRAGSAGAGKQWLRGFALLLLAIATASAQESPASPPPGKVPDASEINSVLRQLSEITGFQVRRQLPFQMLTRDQINAYIRNQIKHSVRVKDIQAEELSMKKLGFAPADFDLRQTTIDLLTEQAAAFYDFHQKKLFISEWAATSMRDEALVHELAHALADQNYNIEKYLNKEPADAEQSLARQAVVEGQASWLTVEFAARQAGKTLSDPETAREFIRPELDPDDPQYPVFSKAPLYLRATMLFPYSEGQSFQQAIFLKAEPSNRKSAFALLFSKPPVSSSQILHPDRYIAGTAPVAPELPKPAPGMKAHVEGIFGEEDMQVLLRQYTTSSTSLGLAPEFNGGRYRIDDNKKDHSTALVFATDWASEDAATAFVNAYQKVLEKKWKSQEGGEQGPLFISGKSEDGYYRVERKGKTVLSREGFPAKL